VVAFFILLLEMRAVRSSSRMVDEPVAVFGGFILRGGDFSGVGWGKDSGVAQVPHLHNAAFQGKYILYGGFGVTVDGEAVLD